MKILNNILNKIYNKLKKHYIKINVENDVYKLFGEIRKIEIIIIRELFKRYIKINKKNNKTEKDKSEMNYLENFVKTY